MRGLDKLARDILESDTAFLWVTIFNTKGVILAQEFAKGYVERFKVEKETRDRLVALDAIFLEAFSQAEKWYGRTDFLLLAYERSKIMLMYNRKRKLHIAAKIPRSAMAECLFPMSESILNGD